MNWFLDGWDYQLALGGWVSGIYGSSCGSAMGDWSGLSNPPTDIFAAQWNGVNSVWNLSCISNTWWTYDQRHHQFRGGHAECYGNCSAPNYPDRLNIDSDCANGVVINTTLGATDSDSGQSEGSYDSTEDASC